MKRSELKNIIKEEIVKILNEAPWSEERKDAHKLKQQLADIEKRIKNRSNTLFGTEAFVLNTYNNKSDKFFGPNKSAITSAMKEQPYTLWVLETMDPNLYLGMTKREWWWIGDSMDNILSDVAFAYALGSLQGKVKKYIVYKNGKPIYKGTDPTQLKGKKL